MREIARREDDLGNDAADPPGLVQENLSDSPASVFVLPWLISAKTESALRVQAGRLASYVRDHPGLDVDDVGLSLANTEASLECRAALVGGDRDELLAGLAGVASGRLSISVVSGRTKGNKTAFLFTGQGSQRAGAGAELYRVYPVFAEALDEVCAHMDPYLGRSLKELLFAVPGSFEAGLLDRPAFTQPALFAVEVALFRLVESWGLTADLVMGHSIGELVAAYVAGVWSLPDACAVVASRGYLMGELPPGGGMVAVAASEGEVVSSLAALGSRLSLAAVNGPSSVVVSGDQDALDEFVRVCESLGREATWLDVDLAFHSARMEPILKRFATLLAEMSPRPPRLGVVSNLTGRLATAEELMSPGHWVRHARYAVRFGDGVRFLAGAGVSRFVELGPSGQLSRFVALGLSEHAETARQPLCVPLLRAGCPEVASVMRFAAQAFVAGVDLELGAVLNPWASSGVVAQL